jgi:hypothetical protein
MPFATLSASDNEYDRFSNLDREGVFRLNIGVSKNTFHSLFGSAPIDRSDYDFTVLDKIMPHPEYAAQQFICVLRAAVNWTDHSATDRLISNASGSVFP